MHWNDNLKIGIPIVDTQHKQLFNTYAELNLALKKGIRPSVVRNTLERLQLYITRHFIMEEKYMRESGYQGIEEQVKAHHYFSEKFGEIFIKFQHEGLTSHIVKTIQMELSEWLIQHVSGLDMEFGRYYNDQKR